MGSNAKVYGKVFRIGAHKDALTHTDVVHNALTSYFIAKVRIVLFQVQYSFCSHFDMTLNNTVPYHRISLFNAKVD